MKRIFSVILAILLLILPLFGIGASGISDTVPAPFAFEGFEDLNETKAAVFDIDSGAVIYQRSGDSKANPGSLTVIMTALILIENTDNSSWDRPLEPLTETNSKWSSRGAKMGLEKGDTPTRRDLLYALLMEGAADAAFVTEMLISGSENDFVELMNSRAEQLSMTCTHYENGYGLGSGDHYTCANDMVLLTLEAMKHEVFSEAVREEEYLCSLGCRGIALHNTNTSLGSSGCIGIKSGSDSEKAHSVILAYEAGSARIAAVVLEAPSDIQAFSFADRLISCGFTDYLSECGLRSYKQTDALCRTDSIITVYSEPDGSPLANFPAGKTMRICGSAKSGSTIWYCIFDEGAYKWIKSADVEFVCYINDIFIECGDALSKEITKGEIIELDSFVSSRHKIKSITLSLNLPDGTQTFRSTVFPCSHGKNTLYSTGIAESLRSLLISEGLYVCTIDVEAEASVEGEEPISLKRTGNGLLAVGTGGNCVAYNANMGENAPLGECFFDSFTVSNEIPTRAGYVFDGWNTSPEGNGNSYQPGQVVEADDSITLYALWNEGEYLWDNDARIYYEYGLIIEGFIRNNAGVTSLRMTVESNGELIKEIYSPCLSNEVEPGSVLVTEPVILPEGEYIVEVFASAGGQPEEKILSQSIEVGKQEETQPPVPTETIQPSQTSDPYVPPNDFSLAGIPIWIWFLVGTLVVAGLITWIVIILKRG